MSIESRIERVSAFHRRIHTEIVIDAPCEHVWRVMTDWDRLHEWSPTLRGVVGDIGHGQTVACVYRFRGKDATPKHTLYYDEGRAFGWSDPLLPGLIDRHLFQIEAMSDGRTKLIQSDEVRGPLCPVLGSFFLGEMAATYPQYNRALKARVEAESKPS
jgi:hypothetical protein